MMSGGIASCTLVLAFVLAFVRAIVNQEKNCHQKIFDCLSLKINYFDNFHIHVCALFYLS